MHKDYAIEVYNSLKNPVSVKPLDDLSILKKLVTDEIVDFAKTLGDEKISSICSSVQESYGYRYNSGKIRKRITDKQQFAIASFLIEKFGSTKNVICSVFNVGENDFLN